MNEARPHRTSVEESTSPVTPAKARNALRDILFLPLIVVVVPVLVVWHALGDIFHCTVFVVGLPVLVVWYGIAGLVRYVLKGIASGAVAVGAPHQPGLPMPFYDPNSPHSIAQAHARARRRFFYVSDAWLQNSVETLIR